MLAARQEFASTFGRDVNSILVNPEQRARFNQLQAQYMGYDAFLDPTIRQRSPYIALAVG